MDVVAGEAVVAVVHARAADSRLPRLRPAQRRALPLLARPLGRALALVRQVERQPVPAPRVALRAER